MLNRHKRMLYLHGTSHNIKVVHESVRFSTDPQYQHFMNQLNTNFAVIACIILYKGIIDSIAVYHLDLCI